MNSPWRDLAAAYALDALDEGERAAFEARLELDPELRRLVAEYRETASAIGTSLDPREAPAGLRERILARARLSSQEKPVADPRADTVTIARPRQRRAIARLAGLAFAASLAGLLLVSLENRQLLRDRESLRQELAQLRATLGDAAARLARLDSLAPLLAGPDVRFATLTSEATAPRLRLLWNPARRVLVVAASNLAVPAAGRTYQLWGIRGSDDPISLGTFEPSPDGTALVLLAPAAEVAFDLSAVTEEPAGGSPQPTSTPLLAGPWSTAGS